MYFQHLINIDSINGVLYSLVFVSSFQMWCIFYNYTTVQFWLAMWS